MKQQDPGQDSKPERKTAYTDELLAEETKKICQPSKSSGRALMANRGIESFGKRPTFTKLLLCMYGASEVLYLGILLSQQSYLQIS